MVNNVRYFGKQCVDHVVLDNFTFFTLPCLLLYICRFVYMFVYVPC